uniref:F-box domain-containing protein n=1 Tax=Ditylenchus dipsaci TaxID=166011 RepID=A0A915EH84_9BILA
MERTTVNDVSLEILAYIFEHLNYRQRVQIERVCSYWQLAGKLHAWKKIKRLKFTHKMLCLKEPWNDARDKFLRNPTLYKHPRPSRCMVKRKLPWSHLRIGQYLMDQQLGAFSAIIQRCGPYLTELHLQDIGVQTRFGRYFRFMPHLKHLRIDKPLDKWHLQEIDKFFSTQLVSLVVTYNKEKHHSVFKQILCKSSKLECLRVDNVYQLFEHDKQKQLQQEQLLLTPNLKYLQITADYYSENPLDEVLYANLLKHCPNLQFLFINGRGINGNILNNHLLMAQLLRLQLPYCNRLSAQPSLNCIKALKLSSYMNFRETLQLVAKNVSQLEHLELHIYDSHINYLKLLYPLNQLSSLRLVFIIQGDPNGHWPIDDFYVEGEKKISSNSQKYSWKTSFVISMAKSAEGKAKVREFAEVTKMPAIQTHLHPWNGILTESLKEESQITMSFTEFLIHDELDIDLDFDVHTFNEPKISFCIDIMSIAYEYLSTCDKSCLS